MKTTNKTTQCKVCSTTEVTAFYPKNKSKCKACISKENKIKHAQRTPEEKQERYEYHARWTINNIIHSKYMAAKHRAAQKNLDFTIEELEVYQMLVSQNYQCSLSGITFNNHHKDYSPSIERIDSSRGYTSDNIMLVCTVYNYMKNDSTPEEFDIHVVNLSVEKMKKRRPLTKEQEEFLNTFLIIPN